MLFFFKGFKVSKSVCLAGCGCVYRTETCDQNFKAVILRVRRGRDFCWFPEEQAGHRRLCQMSPMSRGPKHCWARPPHFLWDHWKGREHTRLEQRFRIMSNRPLLDKSCRPVSLEEDRRIRAERMSEPPVILESEFKLTVEERIAIEIEEEASGAKPQLSETSAAYLWLCCFINGFVELRDFASMTRFVESWSSTMRGEVVFAERALSYSKCQVTFVFVYFFISVVCFIKSLSLCHGFWLCVC